MKNSKKLLEKFSTSELRNLSKCVGGRYVPTTKSGGGSDRYVPQTGDIQG